MYIRYNFEVALIPRVQEWGNYFCSSRPLESAGQEGIEVKYIGDMGWTTSFDSKSESYPPITCFDDHNNKTTLFRLFQEGRYVLSKEFDGLGLTPFDPYYNSTYVVSGETFL